MNNNNNNTLIIFDEEEFDDQEDISTESENEEVVATWHYDRLSHNPEEFKRVCKFTVAQFDQLLWPYLDDIVERDQSRGGRHPKLCPKSKLILVLSYLRTGTTYADLCPYFGISKSRARQIIKDFIPKMIDRLEVNLVWKDWNLQNEHLSEIDGNNFSRCVGIVDAMEQPINRPKNDQQLWYSGKSKMHTIKSQIVVEPVSGRIIHCIAGVSGRIHDKRLFDESGVLELVRNNEYIMADSGYQGIQADVRALLPVKKPRNRDLTSEEKLWNRKLSSKRILVEHVIGRLQNWKILKNRWTGKYSTIELYRIVFRLCAILTNILLQ